MTLKTASKPRRSNDTPLGVVRKLEAGLPFSSFSRLQKQVALSPADLSRITRISQRTLARRKTEGRFDLDESDRIHRVAAVVERAIDFFDGDLSAARRWLQKPR